MSTFRFIEAERASHSDLMLCKLLSIFSSGYSTLGGTGRRLRESRFDAVLSEKIEMIHRNMSRATYGAPGVHAELRPSASAVAGSESPGSCAEQSSGVVYAVGG